MSHGIKQMAILIIFDPEGSVWEKYKFHFKRNSQRRQDDALTIRLPHLPRILTLPLRTEGFIAHHVSVRLMHVMWEHVIVV